MNDIKILELLASKICHDLISPVGAISNGIEIMEEMGAEAAEEVTALIASSTTQANAKLKTLRMVYGLGGADESIRAADIHSLFGEFIASEKRLSQDWDPYADLGIEPKAGFAKILLATLILTSEALPKGGIVGVRADEEKALLITGKGENADFHEKFMHALEHKTSTNDLSPKYVHAYVTGLLAENYGFKITINNTENNFICLRLTTSDVL